MPNPDLPATYPKTKSKQQPYTTLVVWGSLYGVVDVAWSRPTDVGRAVIAVAKSFPTYSRERFGCLWGRPPFCGAGIRACLLSLRAQRGNPDTTIQKSNPVGNPTKRLDCHAPWDGARNDERQGPAMTRKTFGNRYMP